jgi:hypothetical protein
MIRLFDPLWEFALGCSMEMAPTLAMVQLTIRMKKNRNSASVSLEPELALTKVFYPVKCTGSSLLWALLIF